GSPAVAGCDLVPRWAWEHPLSDHPQGSSLPRYAFPSLPSMPPVRCAVRVELSDNEADPGLPQERSPMRGANTMNRLQHSRIALLATGLIAASFAMSPVFADEDQTPTRI